jgi:hypothetical protein
LEALRRDSRPIPLADGLQIAQKLGLIEAFRRAFGGEPVLAKQRVRLVAVLLPEGRSYCAKSGQFMSSKALLSLLLTRLLNESAQAKEKCSTMKGSGG